MEYQTHQPYVVPVRVLVSGVLYVVGGRTFVFVLVIVRRCWCCAWWSCVGVCGRALVAVLVFVFVLVFNGGRVLVLVVGAGGRVLVLVVVY